MALCNIEVPQEKVADFCRRWKVTELSLFGSVLRDDFKPDSDIDILVSLAPGARWGLSDLVAMEEGLGALFGRKVDLHSRKTVEESENYIRRRHILASLEPVYVA